jgi:hypothetical protein
VVRVGDAIAFPLYDGEVSYAAPNLHRVGTVAISRHDLFHDLGYDRKPLPYMPASVWDSASTRAELFRATQPGRGMVLVALRLAHLRQQCVSCRTLHYFFDVKR